MNALKRAKFNAPLIQETKTFHAFAHLPATIELLHHTWEKYIFSRVFFPSFPPNHAPSKRCLFRASPRGGAPSIFDTNFFPFQNEMDLELL